MASERKRASTPKRSKATVAEKSRGTVEDPRPKDPEKARVKQMQSVLSAIQRQHALILHVLAMGDESKERTEAWARESREGMSQVRGELEQIRTHLIRFIDQGIRERGRDERIEAQLAGINERLRERSKVDRAMHHGKMVTAEELAAKLDAMERAKGEDIATLRGEVDRLRSELEAARATVAALEGMTNDPLDHRRMPPPRKSWRAAAAENVAATLID
jgi:chromosome segregation ATPase